MYVYHRDGLGLLYGRAAMAKAVLSYRDTAAFAMAAAERLKTSAAASRIAS